MVYLLLLLLLLPPPPTFLPPSTLSVKSITAASGSLRDDGLSWWRAFLGCIL
jgi:hypothetical protein